MKVTAIFIALLGFFIIPQVASANVSVSVSGNNSESNVSVHQEGSSQITKCINGKCETTGATGKTTVCKNGSCTTSEDGNFHYESVDGTTKIHVNNNSETNQVANDDNVSPAATIDPKIKEKIEDAKKKAEEARDQAHEHAKAEKSSWESFINTEIESLQKLLDKLF